MNQCALGQADGSDMRAIIPRKAIQELGRLLDLEHDSVDVTVTDQHVCFQSSRFQMTTSLLQGNYPDCARLLPKAPKHAGSVGREDLRQALMRASILSNDQCYGVRLGFNQTSLDIEFQNNEHELAKETIPFSSDVEGLTVAFNIVYLLDVLNVLDAPEVTFSFSSATEPLMVEDGEGESQGRFLVMPLTL